MGEGDQTTYDYPVDYSQLDPSQYDIPATDPSLDPSQYDVPATDPTTDPTQTDYTNLDPSQYDIPAQDPSQPPTQYDPSTDWTDPNYTSYMTDVTSDPNSGYYDPTSQYYDPTLDSSHPAYDSTLDPYSSGYVPLTEPGSGLQLRNDINYAPDQLMPQDVSLPYDVWNDPSQYTGLGNVAGQTAGDVSFPWMTSTSGGGGGGGFSLSGGGLSLGGKGSAPASSNPLSSIGTDMSKLLSQILGYNLTKSLMPNTNSAATLPKVSISPASGNPTGAASLFGYGSAGTGAMAARTVTPSSVLSGVSSFLSKLTTGQKLAGAAAIVAAIYLMRRPQTSSRVVYRSRRKAA